MTEQVIEIDLKDEPDGLPGRFVKCECWTTGEKYILRVDPRIEQTKTCRGALAWTFGETEKEYYSEIET